MWGSIILLVVLACAASAQYNPTNDPYSWPMLGGNLQRNSMSNQPALKNGTKSWLWRDPNGIALQDNMPVYDNINEVVWTTSMDFYVYLINATTGVTKQEICLGESPEFPGDPCGGILFDQFHHGQLTMLPTSRDTIILFKYANNEPDGMARLSAKDGSVVWNITLFNSSYGDSYNSYFLSLPVVLPLALNGTSDAIMVWVLSHNCSDNVMEAQCAVYTVYNADTAEVILAKNYFGASWDGVTFVPPIIDPVDGSIITTYTSDLTSKCNSDYECNGLGKYHALTGELIWNVQTVKCWPSFAAYQPNGILQVSTSQTQAYSFWANTSKPIWAIDESSSSGDMFNPSICSDGTIIFPDNMMGLQGWSPVIERNKVPLWNQYCPYCSQILVTTNDGQFYTIEQNVVTSRSCTDGSQNWMVDFGDYWSSGSVAVGKGALYANVYIPADRGGGGALAKIVDSDSE